MQPTPAEDERVAAVDQMFAVLRAAMADYRDHIARTDVPPARHLGLEVSHDGRIHLEADAGVSGLAAMCSTLLAWHATLATPSVHIAPEDMHNGPSLEARGALPGGTPFVLHCYPNEEETAHLTGQLSSSWAVKWLQDNAITSASGS